MNEYRVFRPDEDGIFVETGEVVQGEGMFQSRVLVVNDGQPFQLVGPSYRGRNRDVTGLYDAEGNTIRELEAIAALAARPEDQAMLDAIRRLKGDVESLIDTIRRTR